jgi:2-oxoisovalerate dehydrogenase E1 component
VTEPAPRYDWREVARLALASRLMDELEERELTPQGHVTYQFSARGHELGQLLLAQLLTRPFDAASVYYRSRPFMLASGLTLTEALAADMARAGGFSEGRDVGVVFNMPRRGRALVLPMAADVGSQFTPAAGWAQAIGYRRDQLGESDVADSIAVVFGGEGAVASNGFWSALTLATTLRLPLLFVIEDNNYAISVKSWLQTPGGNIAANLASFRDLAIWDGSGVKPEETAALVASAVAHVRGAHVRGGGPGLLRLTVPRLSGHSSVDNQAYKTEEERDDEWARDPIPALRSYLVPRLMTEAEWQALETAAAADVAAARDVALAEPLPDPARVTDRVWSLGSPRPAAGGLAAEGVTLPPMTDTPQPPDPRRLTMVEAIRRTLDAELTAQPTPVALWRGRGPERWRPRGDTGLAAQAWRGARLRHQPERRGHHRPRSGSGVSRPRARAGDSVPQVRRPGHGATAQHWLVALADGRALCRAASGAHARRLSAHRRPMAQCHRRGGLRPRRRLAGSLPVERRGRRRAAARGAARR